jgi:hypothetical protein
VALVALTVALPASAQKAAAPLPPDIDPQSYSRLPLIRKDSLDAEGQHNFEVINGPDVQVPRLGPPANSLYSPAAAEPYDVLNQRLRKTVVGPAFFETCTLVPAREYNQITIILGDYTMTAMLLNAVDQHLSPGREPMLPMR